MGNRAITKTAETIEAYLKRGNLLWMRASRELDIPPNLLPPIMFIEWLKRLLITLKASSKRQYIASAKELLYSAEFNKIKRAEIDVAINIVDHLQGKDFIDLNSKKINVQRTSSNKAKQFKHDKFVLKMQKELKNTKSKWDLPALVWITGNVMVGLRPVEWRLAKLIKNESKVILMVKNAKSTNGRSHGEFRTIDISSFDKQMISIIKTQIKYVSEVGPDLKDWTSYYNSIRKRVYILVRKVGKFQKRYPSLYSTRHQFAANAKSSGLDIAEIAALMGHATDLTVQETYGRARDGSGQFTAKANIDEVARVKSSKPKKSMKFS